VSRFPSNVAASTMSRTLLKCFLGAIRSNVDALNGSTGQDSGLGNMSALGFPGGELRKNKSWLKQTYVKVARLAARSMISSTDIM